MQKKSYFSCFYARTYLFNVYIKKAKDFQFKYANNAIVRKEGLILYCLQKFNHFCFGKLITWNLTLLKKFVLICLTHECTFLKPIKKFDLVVKASQCGSQILTTIFQNASKIFSFSRVFQAFPSVVIWSMHQLFALTVQSRIVIIKNIWCKSSKNIKIPNTWWYQKSLLTVQ
jgi:hypothetical protein